MILGDDSPSSLVNEDKLEKRNWASLLELMRFSHMLSFAVPPDPLELEFDSAWIKNNPELGVGFEFNKFPSID